MLQIFDKTLKCYIDMPSGATLSIEDSNRMLNFDIKAARTTTLKLPRTANNLRVFGYNSTLQSRYGSTIYGQQVGRTNVRECQVVIGDVVLEGKMYMLSMSDKDISVGVVLLIDNVVQVLEQYKDMTVKDMVQGSSAYTDGGSVVVTDRELWGVYWYGNPMNKNALDNTLLMPSINLRRLMLSIMPTLSVGRVYGRIRNVRWIPKELQGADNIAATLQMTVGGGAYDEVYTGVIPQDTQQPRLFDVVNTYRCFNAQRIDLQAWQVREGVESVERTFPDDIPDTIFCVRVWQYDPNTNTDVADKTFFEGGYSFDTAFYGTTTPPVRAITGTPLAGRKITIARTLEVDGAEQVLPFVLVDIANFRNDAIRRGFNLLTTFDNAVTVSANLTDDVTELMTRDVKHYLADNAPEVKVIEMLQMLCELSNAYVAESSEGIQLLPRVVADNVIHLRNVLEIKTIERKVKDYKRTNVVRFDSSDEVKQRQRITQAYNVPNNTLESETNELFVIKGSEGQQMYGGAWRNDFNVQREVDDDGNVQRTYTYDADKPMLFVGSVYNERGQRVTLPRFDVLAELCEVRWAVEVVSVATFTEYLRILKHPSTAVEFEGQRWVWDECKWSDGKMTIKMYRLKT